MQRDALGHTTHYSYDANGNLARQWQELHQPDNTVLWRDVRYSYDKENHLTEQLTLKQDGKHKNQQYYYNAFGELSEQNINGRQKMCSEYDTQGRIWRSNSQGFYQIYVYDLLGNVTQVVSASNFALRRGNYELDLSLDIYAQARSYNQDVWRYELQRQNTTYDKLGHIITTAKEYTAQYDEQVLTCPTQHFRVDRWGNLLEAVSASQQVTTYEYNALNQLIRQQLPTVTVMDEHGVRQDLRPVTEYAYDALGHMIGVGDAYGNWVSKEYDAAGQVVAEIDAQGHRRTLNYNLLQQLTQRINELGGITTYTYDAANRLVYVSTPANAQNYVYNEAGDLIQQTNAMGERQIFGMTSAVTKLKEKMLGVILLLMNMMTPAI